MSSAKAAATDYHRGGWCPIPVKERSKATSLGQLAPYLKRRATREELDAWTWGGVGIVTGPLSGLLVLDVDGPRGEAKLNELGHPPTPMVRTAGGGLHLYFKHPGEGIRTGIRVAPEFDVKAAGGYVVAPPSLGANGRRYEWLVSPEEAEPAEPPGWLMDLLKRPRRHGAAPPVGKKIPSGRRNKELTSIAGTMRRRGMEEDEILAALQTANKRRCDPPLEAEEVRRIAASVARYEPADNVVHISANGRGSARPSRGHNLTDLGNSERFVADHCEGVRYCYPWRKWLVWTGTRWEHDEAGKAHRLAKETVRGIYREASDAEDEDRRKALAKHAAASESETRIRAMIELAKSEVPVSPNELDSDPWLVNVLNGTIALRTGDLREHRRQDLITKLAPVEYDPEAQAPTFDAFIRRILPSEALRRFVMRVIGYAAAGVVSEEILAILYGVGANGKSTLVNTVMEALGDYATQAAPDLLLAKKGSHPTELADLFGARFVGSVEVDEGRRLAEGLVKQLTGRDRIKARRMREDFWEFDPTHTVFLATNHRPEVRGTDHAIWRRLKLVPFEVTIPEAEQDKGLAEKLRAEMPGILAWIVRGCLEWRRDGLGEPDEVKAATTTYRAEMDVLAAFIEDQCVVHDNAKVASARLYNAYRDWCQQGGEAEISQTKFSLRLKERGYTKEKDGLVFWHGIGLRDNRPDPGPGSGGNGGDAAPDPPNLEGSAPDPPSGESSIGKGNAPDPAGGFRESGHNNGINDLNVSHMTLMPPNLPNPPTPPESSEDGGPAPRAGGITPRMKPRPVHRPELLPEQAERAKRLMAQGMSAKWARKQVLATGHPIGCECEVCS